jgi:hypothetical protein
MKGFNIFLLLFCHWDIIHPKSFFYCFHFVLLSYLPVMLTVYSFQVFVTIRAL